MKQNFSGTLHAFALAGVFALTVVLCGGQTNPAPAQQKKGGQVKE